MKRPFLVASDLGPCMSVDETQQKNGDYTDWGEMDVILRAYRYAMILAEGNLDIKKATPVSWPLEGLCFKVYLFNSFCFS